ncbi:MAG: malto-oligosyltrehalose trehalohydrolase [Rhodospirillaceae bacterium]|nr:malto-oligosyltrehalose trehalohydrolase [Rhodospirillaceae bacterium]
MRFRHVMPFGAELRPDGVRFRLWAPGRSEVRLVLCDGGGARPAMRPVGHGWFELVTDAAGPGTRYRFALADGLEVPDPASRYQPDDAHGPSQVIDPSAYDWVNGTWRGRPWHEAVIYELHVGAFSDEGTFDGVRRRLDHLAGLGVTAVELMPIADFPGRRNWGYDGVLPFAPDSAYGPPETLKRLVDEAHGRGLMVFLDVVYNHFGPDGNYLHVYAPRFFDPRRHTPWGAAINMAERTVRDFFIENALYWLEEYRFDGLRLDAVDQIADDTRPHILEELAATVRARLGPDRHVHLVLENDLNAAHYLERDARGSARKYTAQWNDDYHHAAHVLLTGEDRGYYGDYQDSPVETLARILTGGFAYQGEPSAHRGGRRRGEPSGHLPPAAFVHFLQNHDQIGNRAFGERLDLLSAPDALGAMLALTLLGPSPPLMFMGEEWGCRQPFLFFCDFHDELAAAVRDGRRREFRRFHEFEDPALRQRIPDPNDEATFLRSRLDWHALDDPVHARRLAFCRTLLRLRHELLSTAGPAPAAGMREAAGVPAPDVLRVCWRLGDGSRLRLLAKLGPGRVHGIARPPGRLLFSSRAEAEAEAGTGADAMTLAGWTTLWFHEGADR